MNRWVFGAAIVGALAVGGVAAEAQSDGGTINSCVNRAGGLRIVEDPSQCKSAPSSQSETPLSWTSGISGYQVVETTRSFTGETGAVFNWMEVAFCPAGKVPLGGGASVINDDDPGPFGGGGRPLSDGDVQQNGPWTGENGELGWMAVFDVDNPLEHPFTFHTYVYCAFVAA